ncbi:hypothetical protein B566_EDAN008753 [Ephemera danica]|nr:hypothetical protein B566_EDAN008753 [Ephemera danica]
MSSCESDCVVVSVGEPTTTCDCGCKKPIEAGFFHESVRLKSYPKDWPYPVTREELARYGFKYVGPEDKVECWKCGVKINNWDFHDLAGVEHYFWNPKCALLNRKAWWGFKIMPERYVALGTLPQRRFILTEDNNTAEDEKWFKLKMEEMYRCENKRLESFAKVEWKYAVSKEDLAKYGFYYIGGKDTVKCHFCGLIVNGWQPYDLAFLEHLRSSPDCPLIKRLATMTNVTKQESDKKEKDAHEEFRRLMSEMDGLPNVWENMPVSENQLGVIDLDEYYGQDLCGTSPRTSRRLDESDNARAILISDDEKDDDDVLFVPSRKKSKN